jgi:hypothetical protein
VAGFRIVWFRPELSGVLERLGIEAELYRVVLLAWSARIFVFTREKDDLPVTNL